MNRILYIYFEHGSVSKHDPTDFLFTRTVANLNTKGIQQVQHDVELINIKTLPELMQNSTFLKKAKGAHMLVLGDLLSYSFHMHGDKTIEMVNHFIHQFSVSNDKQSEYVSSLRKLLALFKMKPILAFGFGGFVYARYLQGTVSTCTGHTPDTFDYLIMDRRFSIVNKGKQNYVFNQALLPTYVALEEYKSEMMAPIVFSGNSFKPVGFRVNKNHQYIFLVNEIALVKKDNHYGTDDPASSWQRVEFLKNIFETFLNIHQFSISEYARKYMHKKAITNRNPVPG